VRHLINIAHGIGAGMLCAVFLYLAGLVLTPRRWDELFRGAGLVILGSTAYVVLGWVAITVQHIPLNLVTVAFAGGVLALAIFRNRRVVDAVIAGLGSRSLWTGVVLFVSFYVVSYAMSWPPVTDRFLPPAWSGDRDLITYVRYARHLLLFGSPDLDGAPFDYLRNPAASHLLAGFSMVFNQDPLAAAMPAQFVLAALISVAIAGVCRSVFALPILTTVVITCISMTNPYLRQIVNDYDLPALMTIPVLLFLFSLTIRAHPGASINGLLVAAVTAAYSLLFMIDPAALFSAMVLQGALLGALASNRNVRGAVMSGVISASIVLVAQASRVRWSFDNLDLSTTLASTMLTIGILLVATVAHIVGREDLLRRVARTPIDRRLLGAGVVYSVVALLGGNMAVHAREGRLFRMPGAWRGIAQLRALSLGELTLGIEHDPDRLMTGMTRYFLPDTKIHVLESRGLPFETISRQSPVLIQDFGCEGVGHRDVTTIEHVGCVLFAPPTFELDQPYPFNRTFLFLSFDGMSDREPGGRWNRGRGISLRLLVDPERTRVNRNLHVNFFVSPFLPGGGSPRLTFKWGANRTGETIVAAEEWISVPVSDGDWTGTKLLRLPISIALPNSYTIRFHDLSVSEEPRGRLVQ
jgi:hypothetical protein